jgi:hypothetical protein
MGGLSQGTKGFLDVGVAQPSVVSISAPTPNTIILTWDRPISLTPFGSLPSSYAIVPPILGGAVLVNLVTLLDSTHLQLTTSDQENGASYQLNVSQGVALSSTNIPNFATSLFFTGNNVALTVVGHRLIDSTDLIVTYSRTVQPATATVTSNYTFVPGLIVKTVERVTDVQYLLRTATMQPNQTYGLTVTNVLALDGSLIQ